MSLWRHRYEELCEGRAKAAPVWCRPDDHIRNGCGFRRRDHPVPCVWKIGILEAPWVLVCRITGALLIVSGLAVWFIGALRSDMDASIAENRLQTSGIYAWVRNPMYSGWWMLFAGICLQWHNVCALVTIPVNWALLTVTLKLTEEKWLLDLYGQDYADYLKRVNRCIPWPPHNI